MGLGLLEVNEINNRPGIIRDAVASLSLAGAMAGEINGNGIYIG